MRTTFLLIVLVAASCKKDSAPPPSPTPSPAPSPSPAPATTPSGAGSASTGFCRYEITGAITGTGQSAGDETTVGADYLSDKPIDPAAKPTILFSVVCKGAPAQLNFYPNSGMGYADVPFDKPGEWKISAGEKDIGVSVAKPGGFLQNGVSGTFKLTRFDAKGMAGSFELDTEPAKFDKDKNGPVHVKGEFDLPCLLPSKICTNART